MHSEFNKTLSSNTEFMDYLNGLTCFCLKSYLAVNYNCYPVNCIEHSSLFSAKNWIKSSIGVCKMEPRSFILKDYADEFEFNKVLVMAKETNFSESVEMSTQKDILNKMLYSSSCTVDCQCSQTDASYIISEKSLAIQKDGRMQFSGFTETYSI